MFNALKQLHWLLGKGNKNITVEFANHRKKVEEEIKSINMKSRGRLAALTLSTEFFGFFALWAASS